MKRFLTAFVGLLIVYQVLYDLSIGIRVKELESVKVGALKVVGDPKEPMSVQGVNPVQTKGNNILDSRGVLE